MSSNVIIIQPLGNVLKEELEELKKGLSPFNYEVKIASKINIPKIAYNPYRNQYLASEFLKIAKRIQASKILCVTDVDLYAPHLNFVFGQAELNGRCAVISLFRLKIGVNRKIFLERMIKEGVHELGHTFGLRHCQNKFCVMHFSNCLEDTDIKMGWFCEKCKKLIKFQQL